ncbi:hypothetical protein PUN28_005636 [Cardiocondyla obscurior]|uniref:Uncharacterized protein n=1 Tax=Cardiocondyla obscurior TaxID=286306 RepID=A0AAW2GJQ9_9HYME
MSARILSRARLSRRLPQIFISGSTANSGRTGRSKRARPPWFFNRPHGKLTASGRHRRHHPSSSYIRAAVCARAAAPVGSWSRRDDACLNLNTLRQRKEASVPSARDTPSEPTGTFGEIKIFSRSIRAGTGNEESGGQRRVCERGREVANRSWRVCQREKRGDRR